MATTPTTSHPAATTVLQVTKRIAHAALLTLPTVPVQMVPAGAADEMLVPLHAIAAFSWTADYTNFDANGRLGFSNGGGLTSSGLNYVDETIAGTGPSVLLGNGESELMVFLPLATVSGSHTYPIPPLQGPAALIGQPLTLLVGNGVSGNYTGGNAANLLVVTVTYFVLAWPT